METRYQILIDIADELDGRQYRDEVSKDLNQLMKENKIVAVFGASDDLVEFRGAINDEVGAGRYTQIPINNSGLVFPECHDECPHDKKNLEDISKN